MKFSFKQTPELLSENILQKYRNYKRNSRDKKEKFAPERRKTVLFYQKLGEITRSSMTIGTINYQLFAVSYFSGEKNFT